MPWNACANNVCMQHLSCLIIHICYKTSWNFIDFLTKKRKGKSRNILFKVLCIGSKHFSRLMNSATKTNLSKFFKNASPVDTNNQTQCCYMNGAQRNVSKNSRHQ